MSIESSVKALKERDAPTGLAKGYYAIHYWWTDTVWCHMPAWLRRIWWIVSYDLWYKQVSARLWPRQRWLTKEVPNTYRDIVELVPLVLYPMVVAFVSADGEDALNTVVFSEEDETGLRSIYAWALTGRAIAQAAIVDAHPALPNEPIESWCQREITDAERSAYDEVTRLEAEFEAKDTEYLVWWVSNRSRWWT